MKTKKMPNKFKDWIDARKKFHLSHPHIQMARELGLNPKKFGSLANHHQELWKAPLPDFIQEIYFKRFGLLSPKEVKSIEEIFRAKSKPKQKIINSAQIN